MELFRLLGTIAIDNSGANAAIDDTTDKAEKSEGKMSKAFSKIGSAAVSIGKTMATGLAAGLAAITALVKSAVDGYADYEQLVGGVETLFKNSADIVQKYADSAYKSAGLSANEYMETVTSFSASLLQSLDNDTAAAAEKANQAIIDMSDNANKMGTAMESIQNAYQGFAKQNYTMLDNLKLGYGGTKEEMQRLLKDATAISGIEYDISSYADVVDAIHVIQEEMGITGTTAKEASSTISGSLSSMKSAWKNLVSGLGNEDVDISLLVDKFMDSLLVAADNLLPRIEIILNGIAEMLAQIVPKITEKLPGLLNSMLPSLIQGAVALINGLIAALPTILQILIEQIPFIVTQIGSALVNAFPQLLAVVKQLFGRIWDYISSGLLNIGASFEDALGKMGEIFDEYMLKIQTFFQDAMLGIKYIWENYLKPVFEGICDFLTGAFSGDWEKAFGGIEKIVNGVLSGIENAFNSCMEFAKDVVKKGVAKLKELFNFDWELPDFKLPHFNISGSFSLNPPSVPSFGIDWYAKAMDDPMIMNSPTAFGINSLGQLMAGGEAGSEVVSGTDTLMNMISDAVAAKNARLEELLAKILAFMMEYMPQMANMKLVTDTGALIGELAPGMDEALGIIGERNRRGGC